jgi:hypothetical protein
LAGLPRHGTVAVSQLGANEPADVRALFADGLDIALAWLQPERVLVYGQHTTPIPGEILEYPSRVQRFRATL